MEQEGVLDLTPSPRVLRMLGQIDFKAWQCLAEMIDNSVDAFLTARSDATGVLFPQVNVEISSTADVKRSQGFIRVSDNGPGMTSEYLEAAVRAGYSNNNPVDKLGLFGMGFNVATARLGGRTEVWTTRLEDDFWYGVRIDFDEMERAGSFQVPSLRRPKTAAESQSHGTEVNISKLDQDRALYLRSGGGLKFTRDKLSRVYSKIIREIGLRVIIGGAPLEGRAFCIWAGTRGVDTKGDLGRVLAILPIDHDLEERLYCDDCWVWLLEGETTCPVCGMVDRLRLRTRRVQGWIGIQRFFDKVDYGVDLIRNGRVIEERSKAFFSWVNPDTGEEVMEYPLEQTHWGGRIVGELNVDFVPLASHQKDSFDKSSREWVLVQEVVRGTGPILPRLRQHLGLPERNDSPLTRLHGAYRRGSPPGLRTLVPGDSTGGGINVEPQRWAALFWAGDPDYQTDEKWWNAVVIAEEARTKGKGVEVPADLLGIQELAGAYAETEVAHEQDSVRPEPPVGPSTEEDPALCGRFELPEIPGSPRLDVTTLRLISGRLPRDQHIAFGAAGSRIEMTYDPEHTVFSRGLIEPVDCLVEEVAYQFLARSSTSQAEWPLSLITRLLREKYFRWSLNSYEEVREQADAFLTDLVGHVTEQLVARGPIPIDAVTPEERGAIVIAVARAERSGNERVDQVITTGEFPAFLGPRYIPDLVTRYPEVVFDGHFFESSYEDVVEELRTDIVEQIVTPLRDLLWVTNPEGPQAAGEERRMRLGRAASALRLLQVWRA